MAATQKTPTLADLSTAVKKIEAKYSKELSEIRAEAIRNEQLCMNLANSCWRFAIIAAAGGDRLKDTMRQLAEKIKGFQNTAAPTQPLVKKAPPTQKAKV